MVVAYVVQGAQALYSYRLIKGIQRLIGEAQK